MISLESAEYPGRWVSPSSTQTWLQGDNSYDCLFLSLVLSNILNKFFQSVFRMKIEDQHIPFMFVQMKQRQEAGDTLAKAFSCITYVIS